MKRLNRNISFSNIVGQSAAIKNIFDLIEKVADTDSTVLVTGESGTGKELVARAIHEKSSRRANRMVPINCGAIPEGLMESELFGHEKGAFTGSIKTRIGKFEAADKGTVFLDEIAEMSFLFQVKLLRVLQEREIERVGGSESIPVDVRVIAATNKDLEMEVQNNKFRKDLFYRLNVIPIAIPPLRERREDIPVLIDFFFSLFGKRSLKPLSGISKEAMESMYYYDWPGNVRELENIIERVVILKDGGEVQLKDLPERIRGKVSRGIKSESNALSGGTDVPQLSPYLEGDISVQNIDIPAEGINLKYMVEKLEQRLIVQALQKTGGVKNSAARLLGIKRTTLVEKIKKIGITYEEDKG